VVIVGAGPSGITLANLLRSRDVPCVVLERQTEQYVRQRQRAGVLEHRSVEMYQTYGLDHVLDGFPAGNNVEFRIDGKRYPFNYDEEAGHRGNSLIPQQILVSRLIDTFRESGGDLRFEAEDVSLHDLESDQPFVTYRDVGGGTHRVGGEVIAGCDGFHGPSRQSIPEGVLTEYSHQYGMGWLTIAVDRPSDPPRPVLAVHDQGFCGMFSRGPTATRYAVQIPAGDTVESWPDERIWAEIRVRLGDPGHPIGPIAEKRALEMRSTVFEPMSYGRLFLVGDAAHVVTPMGGKGMNQALFDAETLARALITYTGDGDKSGLTSYSETCLPRVWKYQEYSRWCTEMFHDSGDDRVAGPALRRMARARLDAVLHSKGATTFYAEFQIGVA
jgi:p-hydroxybenzoate 3-monooxygenase